MTSEPAKNAFKHCRGWALTLAWALAVIWLWGWASAASAQDRALGVEPTAPTPAQSAYTVPIADRAPTGNAGLFVGINTFSDDRGIRPLKYAVNDAVAQAHLFVLELRLLPARNTFLALAGEPTTDTARKQLAALRDVGVERIPGTKSQILLKLRTVELLPEDPADLLVVSMSSHGFEDDGVAYAMPTEGLRSYLSDTAIDIGTVEKRLARSKAGKRLLILDACRERPSSDGRGGDLPMTNAFRRALANAQGQAVLASCDAGQISYENDALGHGVFTYYLLEGLRGSARPDAKGHITLGALSDHVASRVRDWAVRNRPGVDRSQVQRPWFEGPLDAREIPLALRQTGRRSGGMNLPPSPRVKPPQSPSGLGGQLDGILEQLEAYDRQVEAALKDYLPTSSYVSNLKRARSDYLDEVGDTLSAAYREQQLVLQNLRREMRPSARPVVEIEQKLKEIEPYLPLPSKVGDTWANSIGMKFVYIPAGEFLMGSPAGEAGRGSDESQHRVRLTESFLMGATEVNQSQWEVVMGSNPSRFKGDDLPVETVFWEDAVSFCKKLSELDGREYRLPTESEWEYACRAGTTTAYHSGARESSLDRVGWHKGNSGMKTHAVGQKQANAWGLHDMHGNVWEWCSDWYAEAYPKGLSTDPLGATSGSARVLRGGSWVLNPAGCRAAARFRSTPGNRNGLTGFRVVCLSPRGPGL